MSDFCLCGCPVSPGPGHGSFLSLALWEMVPCEAVHLQPVGALVTPAVGLVAGDVEVTRSLGVVTQSCFLWRCHSQRSSVTVFVGWLKKWFSFYFNNNSIRALCIWPEILCWIKLCLLEAMVVKFKLTCQKKAQISLMSQCIAVKKLTSSFEHLTIL